MPTPKNYVLSAGDELLINVWGDSELNLKLSISPDGTILIPNVGPVSLSGLTIEAAENRIRQELGKIMATLDGSQPNTFVSVGLGQIRSIKVNIVGEAVAPGTYTLSFQRPLCSRRSKRYRITEKHKSIPEQQRDRQPRCIRLSAEW